MVGRLVVQLASFSEHGTQRYGVGFCYRLSVRTTTCTLNALIVGVAPLGKIIIIIVSSSRRQLPFLANMAESGRHSAAAHSSGRGTAIKLPSF